LLVQRGLADRPGRPPPRLIERGAVRLARALSAPRPWGGAAPRPADDLPDFDRVRDPPTMPRCAAGSRRGRPQLRTVRFFVPASMRPPRSASMSGGPGGFHRRAAASSRQSRCGRPLDVGQRPAPAGSCRGDARVDGARRLNARHPPPKNPLLAVCVGL